MHNGWELRLVAITDRRLMVPPDVLASNDIAAIARAFGDAIAPLAHSGVAVQVREKDLDGAALLALVRAACATGAFVIVNDRLDVALAAGAQGVHVPERGLDPRDARRIVYATRARGALRGAFVIGVSCHSLDGVRAAAHAGADLVQLGPIWDTPGKGPALGTSALTEARAAVGDRHALVAVGGIDSQARVDEALRAGAHCVAAIRAVWSGLLR